MKQQTARQDYDFYERWKEIADFPFGVTQGHVSAICRKAAWAHAN